MTRTTSTLLALIASANLVLAGGPDRPVVAPVAPVPVDSSLEGLPQSGPQSGPVDVPQAGAPEQGATRTLKGRLEVQRSHDTIDLRLDGFELDAQDKLPLSALQGREVEFKVEVTGRDQARFVEAVRPTPWTGTGVVRENAVGLELINEQGRYEIGGLPEGIDSRIKDRKIDARGWVYENSQELVFSGASARIVVATSKDGTPSENAWLNERTVDDAGVATYDTRHTLVPGTKVSVFDLAAYRRAERDDAGKIVSPGIWRPSLSDMVGPDILLARTTVVEGDGAGTTGWIPVRKLSFGEVAPPRDQDPVPPAQVDVPTEVQSGLEGALEGISGDPLPPAEEPAEEPADAVVEDSTPDLVQSGLEEALGGSEIEDLAAAVDGEAVDVDLDLEGAQELPGVQAAPTQAPVVDLGLGEPIARTAMVTASELNVRSATTKASAAKLVLLRGDSVKILEDVDGCWVKVEIAPPQGYVAERLLEPVGSAGKTRTYRVVPSHIKLRETPTTREDNVASYLIGGTELQATGGRGGWVKIEQSEPVVGYVVKSALSIE
ncbi:MAG: SH3 domain-containing protein [Planctomycetota bacterium]